MDHLYARIASGDATARNELVLALQPLARRLVAKRVNQAPSLKNLRSDLESEAITSIITTIDSMIGKQISKPEAYIQTATANAIEKAILSEQPGPSLRTKQRAIADGTYEPLVIESLGDDDVPEREDRCSDILKTAYAVCGDDADRQIIELSTRGHSTKEIAEHLQVTERTVRNRRNHLEARYEAAL
jgi:RNA polymerase sigma factor (sigma-70 family)